MLVVIYFVQGGNRMVEIELDERSRYEVLCDGYINIVFVAASYRSN